MAPWVGRLGFDTHKLKFAQVLYAIPFGLLIEIEVLLL